VSVRLLFITWLVLVVMLPTVRPRPAAAQQGEYLELYVVRYEERGRILIQMRELFEWLGWTVEWDARQRAVTAHTKSHTMTLWVDRPRAVVNAVSYVLDVPPRLIAGKVLVPLRFVAEATGCRVEYLGDAVRISDGYNVLVIHLI